MISFHRLYRSSSSVFLFELMSRKVESPNNHSITIAFDNPETLLFSTYAIDIYIYIYPRGTREGEGRGIESVIAGVETSPLRCFLK